MQTRTDSGYNAYVQERKEGRMKKKQMEQIDNRTHNLFFDIDGTTYQNNLCDLHISALNALQQIQVNGVSPEGKNSFCC
jgi:hypothetical protein